MQNQFYRCAFRWVGRALCLGSLLLSSCKPNWGDETQNAWNPNENPEILVDKDSKFVRKFSASGGTSALPLSGEVSADHYPYSDSYWPDFLGGVAYRWNQSMLYDPQKRQTLPVSMELMVPAVLKNNPNPTPEQWNEALEQMLKQNPKENPRNLVKLTYESKLLRKKDLLALKQLPEQQMLYELAALSPAEKFDILLGNVDTYPMVQLELARVANMHYWHLKSRVEKLREKSINPIEDKMVKLYLTEIPEWLGLCAGWAFASTQFREPYPVIAMNSQVKDKDLEIKVPFGSADIKALMSHYYEVVVFQPGLVIPNKPLVENNNVFKSVGKMCRNPNESGAKKPFQTDKECLGNNAGSFHLVISNVIGLQKKPVLADMDKYWEVWNFPIFNYQSKVIREIGKTYPQGNGYVAAPGTEKIIQMEMTLKLREEGFPAWNPIDTYYQNGKQLFVREYGRARSATNPSGEWKPLEYYLELNSKDEIIGGEWISDNGPDIMWNRQPVAFQGAWTKLQSLYEQSISEKMPHLHGQFQRF